MAVQAFDAGVLRGLAVGDLVPFHSGLLAPAQHGLEVNSVPWSETIVSG